MTILTPAQRAEVVALKGKMSNAAAAKLTGRGKRTIGLLWGTISKQPRERLYPDLPSLSAQDSVALACVEQAGAAGATLPEVHAALKKGGFGLAQRSTRAKLYQINEKLRLDGDPRRVRNICEPSQPARYVFALPTTRAPAPPYRPAHGIPMVQVNGVSLRRLSFLDGHL